MSEREKFVADVLKGGLPFATLCRIYGVSRKTGYLWLTRWRAGGPEALHDQSRRPRSSPHRTAAEVVQLLVAKRRRHPHFGAVKLLQLLREEHPALPWPALCTANRILARAGLVERRKHQRRLARGFCQPWIEPKEANEIWTIDFKGQFLLGDHSWCYPLTLADAFSRNLLVVKALGSTRFNLMWPVVERSFREYGLPAAILSDNGPPFGTQGICGLSSFAVRLLRLGIGILRIEPGHPEQNGRHERMHRTLNAAIRPPRRSRAAQQHAFDAFRKEFNTVRPHAALGGQRPAQLYCASAREYPRRGLPALEYPSSYDCRQVRANGGIKWRGQEVFLSEVLCGEMVGLNRAEEEYWEVYFGPLLIGHLFGEGRFRPAKPPRPPRARAASRSPAGSQEEKKVLPMS